MDIGQKCPILRFQNVSIVFLKFLPDFVRDFYNPHSQEELESTGGVVGKLVVGGSHVTGLCTNGTVLIWDMTATGNTPLQLDVG